MDGPAGTEASPAEREALRKAFEETPSVFQLLSTLRTRRIGRGFKCESGVEETLEWSSGRVVKQAKGPLEFESNEAPAPLSEIEEALIAWAACGPNGTSLADVAVNGSLSSLLFWAGRTIPASSNDQSVALAIVNDSGTYLYRPGPERSAPVEIASPDDYPKVLDWYRRCTTKISDTRPDIGWFSAPEGTHNVNALGPMQYNLNRPGATWFLPVGDLGLEWFNTLLIAYEWWGFYLQDPETNKPAGCDEWIKPGLLEVGFPIPVFDEFILMLHSSQVGCAVQNMRLASEALGLGAWPVGNYADDFVLGAYPDVARGLGFEFLERDADRNPSKTATCVGLPGVFEATAVPTPQYPSAADALTKVRDLRYQAAGGPLSPGGEWATRAGGPYNEDTRREIVENPRAHISDWAIDAAIATVEYIIEKYGVAPAWVSPMRAKFSCQVQHVDPDFYRRFNTTLGDDAFSITPAIRDHDQTWHS